MTSGVDISAAAEELLDMRRRHRIVADLPDRLRPTDLDTAYRIQDRLVAGLLPSGAHRVGYKVACTSPIAQAALNIDRPLFGRLLSHTTSPSGASLQADRFVHRVIEAEYGFRVATDVVPVAGGHTIDSIANHIAAVIPAIEIVDHRFVSWAVGALQVAADNAIHGWWIAGDPVADWQALDLVDSTVTVRVDGDVVTTGSGSGGARQPARR